MRDGRGRRGRDKGEGRKQRREECSVTDASGHINFFTDLQKGVRSLLTAIHGSCDSLVSQAVFSIRARAHVGSEQRNPVHMCAYGKYWAEEPHAHMHVWIFSRTYMYMYLACNLHVYRIHVCLFQFNQ